MCAKRQIYFLYMHKYYLELAMSDNVCRLGFCTVENLSFIAFHVEIRLCVERATCSRPYGRRTHNVYLRAVQA